MEKQVLLNEPASLLLLAGPCWSSAFWLAFPLPPVSTFPVLACADCWPASFGTPNSPGDSGAPLTLLNECAPCGKAKESGRWEEQ